ncbi:MAG: hypothetical protein FJX80_03335 [Bacteroidetes bacterium]|nr:hypothetical protein [Bacteroidota bacterium]
MSLFSFATSMFFSLALCLVISYGMFYYVKKRLSIIEQSQMEQARIMQKVIAFQFLYESKNDPEVYVKKACNNVEGLIEISSDEESEEDTGSESSDTDSESSDTTSESSEDTTREDTSDTASESGSNGNDIKKEAPEENETKKIIHIVEEVEELPTEPVTVHKNQTDEETDNEEKENEEKENEEKENEESKLKMEICYSSNSSTEYENMSVADLRKLIKDKGITISDKMKKKDLVQVLHNH